MEQAEQMEDFMNNATQLYLFSGEQCVDVFHSIEICSVQGVLAGKNLQNRAQGEHRAPSSELLHHNMVIHHDKNTPKHTDFLLLSAQDRTPFKHSALINTQI